MTIKQQELDFFSKFPIPQADFVQDGVVDEQTYLSSNLKILFLLKEPNSNIGGWKLIDHVRSDAQARTFDNLARWAKGICNLQIEIPWIEIKDISPRTNSLNSVMLFNLKKTPGGKATDENELARVASKYSDLLKKQSSFYNPDIVICCGYAVVRLFDQILFANTVPWPSTTRGIQYREFQRNKYGKEILKK